MALWGAGFCPLHPPRLNLSGTGYSCHCGTRRGQGGLPRAALARPAPGERTISNAEVPLPRSPLSLAAGTANRKAVLSVLHRTSDAESPPVECRIGRLSQCRPGSARGCKGRSPLHKKTQSPPLPAGKGVGGMGRQSKLKAGQTGDKEGKPPAGRMVRPPSPVPPGFGRRAPVWQGLYVPQAG